MTKARPNSVVKGQQPRGAAPAGQASAPASLPKPTPSRSEENSYSVDRGAGIDRFNHVEWVIPNGLGGYAMGAASGLPTRRYHGLLIAAMNPPVGRVVALSSVVEALILDPGGRNERTIDLSTYRFADGTVHPRGVELLERFTKRPDGSSVEWRWTIPADAVRPAIQVTKALSLTPGENQAVIRYQVTSSTTSLCLSLRPLAAMRDHHWLTQSHSGEEFSFRADYRAVSIRRGDPRSSDPKRDGLFLHLQADAGLFTPEAQWWNRFGYEHERDRGLDWQEDLYSPGVFTLDVRQGQPIDLTLRARVGDPAAAHTPDHRERESSSLRARRTLRQSSAAFAIQGLTGDQADLDRVARLAEAADDFIVQRRAVPSASAPTTASHTSIIAGYPWFSDWGRDSMISLPGLLLATGRTEQATQVLLTFARNAKDGLIPNCFDEGSGKPHFNTVDASLWFINAADHYLAALPASSDGSAEHREILQTCQAIVDAYRVGTRVEGEDGTIAMDPTDALIAAGNVATQLTWMDARRDGVVFTPRHGKAIEINALWHRALACLSVWFKNDRAGAEASALASRVRESIDRLLWLPQAQHLADVLVPMPTPASSTSAKPVQSRIGTAIASPRTWRADTSFRPNQIFAVSLPGELLSRERQRQVVAKSRDLLLTPMGLRTLAPTDPGYRARFRGPIFERDAAYHNGTVWPWLAGPFAEAVLRSDDFSSASRAEALAAVRPVADLVTKGDCLGQIAEVFDGDGTPEDPRRSGGCPAQAWSIAETLRVMRQAMMPAPGLSGPR